MNLLQVFCAWLVPTISIVEHGGVPYVVPLRRESAPVTRHGRIVSFKTSYSGVIELGTPTRKFRVVFDTGSGHVVVPDAKCETDACRNGKQSYDLDSSTTGRAINSKGRLLPWPLPPGKRRPHVTIGFGTGGIKGEFVRDRVCLQVGNVSMDTKALRGDVDAHQSEARDRVPCLEMHILSCVEMSTNPFYYQKYDGIMGLGLAPLSVSANFSVIEILGTRGVPRSFGVFLTDADSREGSEIVFGGYDPRRLKECLAWSPVVFAEQGYWQVRIRSVRINGRSLEMCRDGFCRAAVDTGSSHLGVPTPFDREFAAALTVDAEDLLDCRLARAPLLELELDGGVLTLAAENYMRRLPVREGIEVGVPSVSESSDLAENRPNGSGEDSEEVIVHTVLDLVTAQNVSRQCLPKTVGISMEEPIGPKFFLLGEPVLQRYYSVFDWQKLAVGFGLANNQRNNAPLPAEGFKGVLPDEVELLIQKFQGLLPDEVELLIQKLRNDTCNDDLHLMIQQVWSRYL